MFFADGSGEKSEGKRAVLGPVFRLESGKNGWFSRQKTNFPGDFQRPNLTNAGYLGCLFFKRY